MADTKDLIVNLQLQNTDLKKRISDTKKDFKGLDTGVKKTQSVFTGLMSSLFATAAAIGAVALSVKKGFDFVKEFARFKQSSDAMRQQFGVNADVVIKKLREVSGGTIDSANLVQAANRAMALNVTNDVDKIAKLLEIARLRAKAMGTDTTDAFNDIVTGIGRACLPPDTMILMASGEYKEIENINPGDMVKSYNFEGQLIDAPVYSNNKNGVHDIYKIFCGNMSIWSTENHKIYTNSGWKFAKDIIVGDQIKSIKGYLSVTEKKYKTHSLVYDLTVPQYENFIANDFVVHNSPLILDNLGIITKGWAEEAKAAGQAYDVQFILNKVIADGSEQLKKAGGNTLTLAERFQKMNAFIKDARLVIGEQLLPVVEKLTGDLGALSDPNGTLDKLRSGVRAIVVGMQFLGAIVNIQIQPFKVFFQTLINGFQAIVTAFRAIKEKGPIDALDDIKKAGQDLAKAIKADVIAGAGSIKDNLKNSTTELLDFMLNEEKRAEDALAEINRRRAEGAKKTAEQILEEERKLSSSKRELALSFGNAALTLNDAILRSTEDRIDREVEDEEDAEAQKLEAKKKAAIANKSIGIFNTILSTAEAIVNALATKAPPPVPEILAAARGIAGAAQTAAIAAQPLPRMQSGGVIDNVLPANISGEDGVIAVQRGESVLNQQATAVLGRDAINALNAGQSATPSVNITVNSTNGQEVVETLNDYFRQFGTSRQGVSI